MQKRYKASIALGISLAGAIATIPIVHDGFWQGLIHHGFLAAAIGGLADWFAVTALFHKPLGISYRTEILRRNRGRLMEAIVRFTSDDLLNSKNIMEVVRQENLASLIVDYLDKRGGREKLRAVIDELLLKVVNSLDTASTAARIAPIIKEGLKSFPLEQLPADVLRQLAEEKHSSRIMSTLLNLGGQVLLSPGMQQAMLDNIKVLRQRYEQGSSGRGFVLETLGLTDERILGIFNQRAMNQLQLLAGRQTEDYARIKASLETMLLTFSNDPILQERMKAWKLDYMEKIDIANPLATWMDNNIKGEQPFWLASLNNYVDAKIDEFITNEAWQQRYDEYVKKFIESELNKHHDMITGLIKERLAEFTDDQLTEFVESRVADDLQMIRINGSIVGSMVGMGLYVLVTLAERL